MMLSNKKVAVKGNLAQQTAQIIANVTQLLEKNIIHLADDTVFLYPSIWKDKATAQNWLSCLHHYYCIKKKFKPSATLYFRDIESEALIGTVINKKSKVLIFN